MDILKKTTDEELAYAARSGNGDAIEALFRRYIPLIKSKSKTYYIIGAETEDVIQEGMIGLFKAVENFDPCKNTAFSTFADMCISRQIISAVKKANRRKHQPLNNSMSIYDPIGVGGDEKNTLADVLSSGEFADPQVILVMREIIDHMISDVGGMFSGFELKVWNERIKGETNVQIAEKLGRTTKAVENALHRIKHKIIRYMNDKA